MKTVRKLMMLLFGMSLCAIRRTSSRLWIITSPISTADGASASQERGRAGSWWI